MADDEDADDGGGSDDESTSADDGDQLLLTAGRLYQVRCTAGGGLRTGATAAVAGGVSCSSGLKAEPVRTAGGDMDASRAMAITDGG